MTVSDAYIERALRWAMVELGTAGLSDEFGSEMLAPGAPTLVTPPNAAIAGPVVVVRRSRVEPAPNPASSFDTLRAVVRPGSVLLVSCDPGVGGAYGSNVALHAACLRAQAIVADGPMRDSTRIAQLGIVCAANGVYPKRPSGAAMRHVRTAEVFGAQWTDGDWFLRDADGVARLDADRARELAGRVATRPDREFASLLAGA